MSTPRKHPQSPSELEFQERDRFDMVYGTNTTTPLAKTGFHDIPNLAHGKAYMASWTSEIEKSFSLIHGALVRRFPSTALSISDAARARYPSSGGSNVNGLALNRESLELTITPRLSNWPRITTIKSLEPPANLSAPMHNQSTMGA